MANGSIKTSWVKALWVQEEVTILFGGAQSVNWPPVVVSASVYIEWWKPEEGNDLTERDRSSLCVYITSSHTSAPRAFAAKLKSPIEFIQKESSYWVDESWQAAPVATVSSEEGHNWYIHIVNQTKWNYLQTCLLIKRRHSGFEQYYICSILFFKRFSDRKYFRGLFHLV